MEKENLYNTVVFILLSIICIAVGAVFLMNDTISTKSFCYLISAFSVIAGIVEISKFFLTKAYKRLNDYSFALGIFMVAMGCTGLLRVNDLANNFTMILGLPVLVIAVIISQFAVQLNAHKNGLWSGELVVSVLLTVASVMILSGMISGTFTYVLLIVAGVLNLFSYGMVFFSIKKKRKEENPSNIIEGQFEEIPHEPHMELDGHEPPPHPHHKHGKSEEEKIKEIMMHDD